MDGAVRMLILLIALAQGCRMSSRFQDSNLEKETIDKEVILTEDDLDHVSCGEVESPGFVEADFDGDGLVDMAGIYKIGRGRQFTEEESLYEEFKVSLKVILKKKNGTNREYVLKNFTHVFPGSIAIQKYEKTLVQEFDSDKRVWLTNPGILFSNCERAASVYYYAKDKDEFRYLVTSD